MEIVTTWSTEKDTVGAVRTAYGQLESQLGKTPDLVIAYSSVEHDGMVLMDTFLATAPAVPLQGGTTCLGVMTAEGFHSDAGVGLGLFGISDPHGDYGVGAAEIGEDARAAGAAAIQRAMGNCDRPGEPPDLVWLSGVPGFEEEVLLGIQSVIGPAVPIAGGSTADNTVEGKWQQFANGEVHRNAVVVTAMYPSVATHLAFHSGFTPTPTSGVVTRAEGRTIYEIDGRPAAEVYNEWTGGAINDFLSGGNVLSSTTLYPIGRFVGAVGDGPYYRLSHPDAVTPEGGLTLFTNVETGEEIVLMAGTRGSLVTRAGRVAKSALDAGRITADQISGALFVYCAGCLLTVQDKMDEVATGVRDALGGKPFIGTFTFGEQGCFVGAGNHHGNLMISVAVFETIATQKTRMGG
ncbi:MAG: FIST C-terminal domain-containing protein [Ardenticatenia bacterium]|nr:FIST C-terminal domain-containing protein [Ardenticatenia bacterium]